MKPPSQTTATLDPDRELWAVLALCHTPGIGPRTIKKILSAFPSAFNAVKAAASWPSRGLASEDVALAFSSRAWEEKTREEHALAAKLKCCFTLFTLPEYPVRLRELPDPPPLLYYQGNLALASGPCLAVVGSRQATRQGVDAAREIAAELSAAGIAVVSGLAVGVDAAAHAGGLSGPGSSIAVLGTGLDVAYPPANLALARKLAEKGLVLTEFAPGAPALAAHFPVRNRIIAGLSLAVVVVEAPEKSGSLITARLAMEQGAEVFAVPGAYATSGYRGSHALINQGARLFESVGQALSEIAPLLGGFAPIPAGDGANTTKPSAPRPGKPLLMGAPAAGKPSTRASETSGSSGKPAAAKRKKGTAPQKPPPDLSPEETAVYERIPAGDTVHIDDLARALGLAAASASITLLGLEVGGLVRKLPGMYYTRI